MLGAVALRHRRGAHGTGSVSRGLDRFAGIVSCGRSGSVICGHESEDVISSLARLRCRADDGAIVVAKHVDPGGKVVGVPHGRHDAERCAAEGGVHLGQLLERVFRRTEGAGEIAV